MAFGFETTQGILIVHGSLICLKYIIIITLSTESKFDHRPHPSGQDGQTMTSRHIIKLT